MSLNINPSSLPNGSVGSAYSQQLTLSSQSSGSLSASWSVNSGSLPPGLSLSGNGSISGTPSTPGTFNFIVSANTGSLIARKQYSVVIQSSGFGNGFSGGSPILPPGQVGVPYSTQLNPSTGTWNLAPGSSLPPNLTLSSSGLISGTPTTNGTFNFLAQVQQGNIVNTQQFTIVIQGGTGIVILPQTLPNGTIGTFYSQQFSLSNSNTGVWSVSSGSLPTGLFLSQSGLLSGTPQVGGTFPITIQTIPSGSTITVSQSYNLVIQTSGITIQPSNLPIGTVGTGYQQQLSLSSGTLASWSVINGSLPPGLSLSPAGLISGTPTFAGGFQFSVQAIPNNGSPTVTQQFNVTIRPSQSGGTQIVINTPAVLPSGTAGTSYSQQLSASSAAMWSLTMGSLPSGLALSSTGLISGTPNNATTSSFTITATPTDQTSTAASQQFMLTIQGATQTLTISNPSPLPNATQGTAYSQQLTVSPSTPVTWSATGLPSFLTLNMSSGLLAGTPTSSGTFNFNVMATPSSGGGASTSKMFTLTVVMGNGGQLTINPSSLPNGRVGNAYSQQLTASPSSGTTSWSLTGGGLPSGLTLSSTGLISGTPNRSESAMFTVQASNAAGTGTQALSITVDQDIVVIPSDNRFSTFAIIAIIVIIVIIIIIIIVAFAYSRNRTTGQSYTQLVNTGQSCDIPSQSQTVLTQTDQVLTQP